MRTKVGSESDDNFMSMLILFHPAWRKMAPACQMRTFISRVVINILGSLLPIRDQNAEYPTDSNNADRLPRNARKNLCHDRQLHGVIQRALLTYFFFLVFYRILNWYTGKHINSLNRYPSTPKECESWKTTKENTHSEKLRGGELALRLEGEKKEAEKQNLHNEQRRKVKAFFYSSAGSS